ncbi:hypothetical protein LTR95_018492, partial [Oleoguttula sp. CCFEE 5521]
MSQHNVAHALPRTPYPHTALAGGDCIDHPPPQNGTSWQQVYQAPVNTDYDDWLDVRKHSAKNLHELATAAIASSDDTDAQWTPIRQSLAASLGSDGNASPTKSGPDIESATKGAHGPIRSGPEPTAQSMSVPKVAMTEHYFYEGAPREVQITHGSIAFASGTRGTVRRRSNEGESELAARRKRPRLENVYIAPPAPMGEKRPTDQDDPKSTAPCSECETIL